MELFHLLEGGHERGGALSTDFVPWCMGTITGRVRWVSVALSSGAKDGLVTSITACTCEAEGEGEGVRVKAREGARG